MNKLTIKNKKSKQVYKKLLITYLVAVLSIVLVLEIYFFLSIHRELKDRDLDYNQRLCQSGADYIQEITEVVSDIRYSLYQNKTSLQDIIWFLDLDTEEYFLKKFEMYGNSSYLDYQGINYFVNESFRYSSYLQSLSFISYRFQKMYIYYPGTTTRTEDYTINKDEKLEDKIYAQNGLITFNIEIRDINTNIISGYLFLNFNVSGFQELSSKYGNSKLVVYTNEEELVYAEPETFSKKEILNTKKEVTELEKQYNVYINRLHIRDLYVVAYIEKKETGKLPTTVLLMLLLMGISLFLIGIYFINLRISHLTNRLETILNGMNRVMEGDLNVVLNVKDDDELDIIADNFNIMCKNLNSYIKKSYLAEIEQKNAQISALQSQINPHFLYNTLEAIRMKAISAGDRDVGKMLYGLAVIFRSQIKDANIVNIAKEIHYCKKYLEIMEFRYQNKFRFVLDCPEDYALIPVIKFIVQPVVENYFIHGIRLGDNDNLLEIKVWKEDNIIHISVKDNGRGMTKEEIDNKMLQMKEEGDFEGSIGILNVHRRMTAVYGKEYGVSLKQNSERGLIVILTFPFKE